MRSSVGHKDNKDRSVKNAGKRGKPSVYGWLVFSDEDAAAERRKRTLTAAAAAFAVLLASVLLFVLMRPSADPGTEEEVESIARGGSDRDVELLLHMDYNGYVLDRELKISVLSERIDPQKAEELFDACEVWLSEELKNGPVFPGEGPGGVTLTWQETEISCLGLDGPSDIVLTVQMGAGEFTRVSEFTVCFDPSAEDYEKSLAALSGKLEEELSSDSEGASLSLPDSADGAVLSWSAVRKQAPVYVIALGAFAATETVGAYTWTYNAIGNGTVVVSVSVSIPGSVEISPLSERV